MLKKLTGKRSLIALACSLSLSGQAVADSSTRIDVPAGELLAALQALAEQADVELVYQPEQLRSLKTEGVKGDYSAQEAIHLLIKGTPLRVYATEKGAIAIVPQNVGQLDHAGAGVRELPAVQGNIHLAQAGSVTTEPQGAPDKRVTVEEVVVTATRRAERLQDVPMSITAITADDIDRRQLVNAADYLRGIPGASQVEGGYGQSIIIRGIETSPHLQNLLSGATTATYFGETPTTNTAGLGASTNIDIKLVDVERVEVLRGPQGTAFGNSSMGGAVRTIPVAPKLDRFEARVGAGYSMTSGAGGDNYDLQAVGNFPLVKDKVAIRGTVYQYQDSGFYSNRAGSSTAFRTAVVTPTGAQAFAVDADEVGAYYVLGGRMAALYQASDDLKFTLSYLSQKTETDGFAFANSGSYEQTVLQVAPQHVIRGRKEGSSDMDIDIASATMEYELSWANLLATYSHTESGFEQAYPYGSAALNLPISSRVGAEHRENVGEVRFVTQLQGAWNFLAGLYVEELKDEADFDNFWHGNPAANIFGTSTALGARADRRSTDQQALFSEVSWEFLPRLTFTGGVRAYEYERSFIVDAGGFFYNGAVGIQRDVDSKASGEIFRANLSYSTDNALLYAGFSQGFRLGQSQVGLPPNTYDRDGDGIVDGTSISIESTRQVSSDDVDSYEIGGKFTLFERRLTIAADVFRMNWTDVPVQVRPGAGACTLGYVANAGEARSEGVELQASFQIAAPLRMDFGGSLIQAEITKDVPVLNAPAGNRLPGSPEISANLGLQYEFQIGAHKASVRADSIYVSSFYGNLQQTPNLKTDGYIKLDASAQMDIGNLNVAVFVRNLTDEDAFAFRSTFAGAGPLFGYRVRPRTVGLRVGYTF